MKDNHLTEKKKKKKSKSPEKLEERLSLKDIEELMGMNRDRYTRRNGAIRRK